MDERKENRVSKDYNKLDFSAINYIFTYDPSQRYTYKKVSNEILRVFKQYPEEDTDYHRSLFSRFYNILSKYVLVPLNMMCVPYVICKAPSHDPDAKDTSIDMMVIKAKQEFLPHFFEDGRHLLKRVIKMEKSSTSNEKRSIDKQYESIEVSDPSKIRNKRVLLLDDIYTSGATIGACEKRLLEAGAKEVIIFTFARTREVIWR